MIDKLAFVHHMIGDGKWNVVHSDGDSVLRVGPFVLKATKVYKHELWCAIVEDCNGVIVDACTARGDAGDAAKTTALDLLVKHILVGNGVVLSPWTVYQDYCAMRFVEGTDPLVVANRVAFIEKTPRVRVAAFDAEGNGNDHQNWWYGPKGQSGSGDAAREQTYGFYPPSRQWCDEQLVAMGYMLPEQ